MTKSNVLDVTVQGAAPSISITASTTSLPSSGGTVDFTGSTNLPVGSTIYWVINGPSGEYDSGSTTVSSSGTFSFSDTFPANTYSVPETYSVYAQIGSVTSNTLTITVAAVSKSINLTSQSATTLPNSGGTVTFSGTATGYNPGQVFYVFVNGHMITTTTLGQHYTFSFTLDFPANNTTSPVTYTIDVSDNTSNQ
jgi:hypothetical protein